MRFFTTAVALAALFVFGFAANPASANCHVKLEAAQAKLAKVPGDYGKRAKIEKLINKAEKFKDDKKKKKKCGNILKKANKLLKKAGKSGGGGGDECATLIKQVEDRKEEFSGMLQKYEAIESNLSVAQQKQRDGKKKACVNLMKKTIKYMDRG